MHIIKKGIMHIIFCCHLLYICGIVGLVFIFEVDGHEYCFQKNKQNI